MLCASCGTPSCSIVVPTRGRNNFHLGVEVAANLLDFPFNRTIHPVLQKNSLRPFSQTQATKEVCWYTSTVWTSQASLFRTTAVFHSLFETTTVYSIPALLHSSWPLALIYTMLLQRGARFGLFAIKLVELEGYMHDSVALLAWHYTH